MKPIEEVKTADEAREIAIDFQDAMSRVSTSWREIARYNDYFKKLATKFPELEEEFKENGII